MAGKEVFFCAGTQRRRGLLIEKRGVEEGLTKRLFQ